MSRNSKVNYSQYVHEFVGQDGRTRWAVAEHKNGQYIRPHDAGEYKATGCLASFAGTPAGIGGYLTRAQALRRARYLFGE